MDSYRVKIFPKNEHFSKDLLVFLFEKSLTIKRDFSIDHILKNESSLPSIDTLFEKNNTIDLNEVYGSTFQSYWRNNRDIYAISHTVDQIIKDREDYFAKITPSGYGEIIDFNKGILKPIYYRSKDTDEYRIVTFDIDFNITKDIDL